MKKLIIALLYFNFSINTSESDASLILLSNDSDPKEVVISANLTKFSPVLKKTLASRNQMNALTSFGCSEKELLLLKQFLIFEQNHPIPACYHKSFKQQYTYESAVKMAAADFQKMFIDAIQDPLDLDQQFALAHFFMLKTIPLVIADLQAKPSCNIPLLLKEYMYTCSPIKKETINAIIIRYIEKTRYAKEKYFFCKHHTDDPFFRGIAVQDLIDYDEINLLLYPNHNIICLSKNKIITLDGLQNIANIEDYTKIYASCNQLHTIHPAIESCFKVRSIYLNENSIKTVPIDLKLQYLKELYLNKNRITEIPSDMGYLKNLTLLNLDQNKIKTIPDSLTGCSLLRSLSLKGNCITTVPSIIHGLQNLIYLNLNGNKITQIPSLIAGLDNLKTLCLAKNSIHEIPQSLTGFDNLQELILYNNHITEIPRKVEGLPLLHTLHLGSNHLTLANINIQSSFWNTLRKKSPIKGYDHLRRLYLMNNNLSIDTISRLEKCINRSRSKDNRLIIKAIKEEDLFI